MVLGAEVVDASLINHRTSAVSVGVPLSGKHRMFQYMMLTEVYSVEKVFAFMIRKNFSINNYVSDRGQLFERDLPALYFN